MSDNNEESFSMIVGKFVIGVLSPINWVIYVRTKTRRYIFRTTDLCSIRYAIIPPDGQVKLTATSFDGKSKLELRIRSSSLEYFGPRIFIPTSTGFRNTPGCREIYTAHVEAKLFESSAGEENWVLRHDLKFNYVALEFGGQFQLVNRLEKL